MIRFKILLSILSMSLLRPTFADTQTGAVKRLAAIEMGSGKTRIEVADVLEDHGHYKVLKTYFESARAIPFSEDFKLNHQKLSPSIQEAALNVLREFKAQAEKFGPIDEYHGVGTAILREALRVDTQNTRRFLSKLKGDLNISIDEISQQEEGRLGYRTGVSKSLLDPTSIAAVWDSGNRSFQITDEQNSYEGPLGDSLVLYLMIEEIQKLPLHKNSTPNPMTLPQAQALMDLIEKKTPTAPQWLTRKFSSKERSTVLALGDPDSLFNFARIATGSPKFNREKVWKAIEQLTPLHDSELKAKGYSTPARAVTQLIFLAAVMRHLGLEEVVFVPTLGNTRGILISPEYWQVWKKIGYSHPSSIKKRFAS